MSILKSPYPFFGGKAIVASEVWKHFGAVENYIEPFAGSLAVMLNNPYSQPKMETINDVDCFIVNFWRALQNEPQEVIKHTQTPVSEVDMHARHKWILEQATPEWRQKMNDDPNFYDAKIAAWWVWGMSISIGNNWLQNKGLNAMPVVTIAGQGIFRLNLDVQAYFSNLTARLRRVRLLCRDWTEIVTPGITYKNSGLSKDGVTAIFLDPPYDKSNRHKVYLNDQDIFAQVRDWAIQHGNIPKLKIALCGYDDDFQFPSNWNKFHWKANGGYSSLSDDTTSTGKQNRLKETIWFNCSIID